MNALERAIKICGSQAKLARAVNVSPQMIYIVKLNPEKMSAELALKIQEATNKEVLAQELCHNFPWDTIVNVDNKNSIAA